MTTRDLSNDDFEGLLHSHSQRYALQLFSEPRDKRVDVSESFEDGPLLTRLSLRACVFVTLTLALIGYYGRDILWLFGGMK